MFLDTDSSLWNSKQVEPPPFVTLDYSKKEYENLFENTTFNALFNNHMEKLHNLFETSRNLYLNEKQILDKLIYKNWNSLRKEKSMQYMKKLKKLLNNFDDLKLDSLIETIKIMNKSTDNTSYMKSLKLCLPTREVYEYLLLRLFGSYRLIEYSIDLVRNKIYIYLIKQIKNGVFLSNNILFMSNISRLYCIIKKYQEQIKFLYNTLREYISCFKSTSVKWSELFNLDDLPNRLMESQVEKGDEVDKNLNTLSTTLSNNVEKNYVPTSNGLVEQDFGEVLDRDLFNGETSLEKKTKKSKIKKDSHFKDKKIFIKNLKSFIESTTKIIEIKTKLKSFLKKKLKKSSDNYSIFLQDFILNDKKKFKNELNVLFDDLVIKKVKQKVKIRKMILKIVKNLTIK